MKQITAVIKPFKLEEVREGLAECGSDAAGGDEAHGKASGCRRVGNTVHR